jgi:hypothetical protein
MNSLKEKLLLTFAYQLNKKTMYNNVVNGGFVLKFKVLAFNKPDVKPKVRCF